MSDYDKMPNLWRHDHDTKRMVAFDGEMVTAFIRWNESDAMRDELLTAIESLKCCGNCLHYKRTFDGTTCSEPFGPAAVFGDEDCHFSPSRWKERVDARPH